MLQNRNAATDEARGVPELTQLDGTGARGNSLPTKKSQAIFAELIGSNTCKAAGITVVDHAPVLALCRALVKAGQDPNRPLHAYRGDVLSLRVRSIGQAARLTVEDDRHGRPRLRRWRNRARECGAGPPVRQIGDTAGRGQWVRAMSALCHRPEDSTAHSPVGNSNQSEFLLACLRAASLRAKLIATELDSVGVALRHNFVSQDGAIEWLRDLDLLDHVLYREFSHDQI